MEKRKIKLAFSDMWGGFEYNPTGKENYDNTLYMMLSEKFDIEISDNPDFLIYSVFGSNHLKYNCKKIFYTGENIRPDPKSDFSITFDMTNGKNYRFPLSGLILFENKIYETFPKSINFDIIKTEKVNFCNFLFSNPNAQLRNQLFYLLNKYKKVDSGGRAYNNLGYLVGDKLEFLNKYKFTICFENSEFPGYTTEKIVHPKLVNSVPIYWGNPEVSKEWNAKSFINAYNFNNMNDLIDYIIEVDKNDDLYYKILSDDNIGYLVIFVVKSL